MAGYQRGQQSATQYKKKWPAKVQTRNLLKKVVPCRVLGISSGKSRSALQARQGKMLCLGKNTIQ